MVVVVAATGLLVLGTAGWLRSLRRDDATVVDHLWGVAQVVVVGAALVFGEERTTRSWVCGALVATWGLRLSAHLIARDRHRGEDFRHREARARRRRFRQTSLVELFWFQLVGGGLVVGLPMLAVVRSEQPPLGWLDALGVAVWATGFTIEVVADLQLSRFRRHPPGGGALLDQGLWRFSRHPNYFGEALSWVGVALLGVAAGAWWSLVSPALVLVVVLRMTGVAAMDRHLAATRGAAYAHYAGTTSPFVPLPRRGGAPASPGRPGVGGGPTGRRPPAGSPPA